MGKKSRSGPGLYFRDLGNNFWIKILQFFDADAEPEPGSGNLFNPKSGMEKNLDPGYGINIPDPQHWIGNISVFLKISIVFAIFCVFFWESS